MIIPLLSKFHALKHHAILGQLQVSFSSYRPFPANFPQRSKYCNSHTHELTQTRKDSPLAWEQKLFLEW